MYFVHLFPQKEKHLKKIWPCPKKYCGRAWPSQNEGPLLKATPGANWHLGKAPPSGDSPGVKLNPPIEWASTSTIRAGVTQPPWLHQFRLGWTQVHPNYWIYYRHWGWVNSLFFPSLISRLPIKQIYSTAQAFQTPTTYLPQSKILNLAVTQELKQCSRRWCYKSNGEVLLQKTMLHRRVEAMLQKRYWSSVIEDVAKVVLQKTLLQKKLVHLWQVSVHQPFFYLLIFHSCFFAQM